MKRFFSPTLAIVSGSISCIGLVAAQNASITNPILPGFNPDPSCIFVKELDSTFFCATSTFSAFPGIPIHASQDLQTWTLIGNALNRPEQLPELNDAIGPTSGIWAPTIRYNNGTFYVVTTLVYDRAAPEDPARWDNFYVTTTDIYDDAAWSDAIHFSFQGYDTSPFWDSDGTAYMLGSHAYRVKEGIRQTTFNPETGELGGEFEEIWLGTGGLAVEGPHTYYKDGWYYLLAAEGGTGVGHMVTMARSRDIWGPYTYDEGVNPVLSNANTSAFFQTVGHADLFQDASGNWWGVALSTRSGPEYINYPMGRETVMTAVTWDEDAWPVWSPIEGRISSWSFPTPSTPSLPASPISTLDFAPGSTLGPDILHWRHPDPSVYEISPPNAPNTLLLSSSAFNLTGNLTTGPRTFLGQRQTHTLFNFGFDMAYTPRVRGEEAGLTVFLNDMHHLSFGISYSTNTSRPQFKFAANSKALIAPPQYYDIPETWVAPANATDPSVLPTLRLGVRASNRTHYTFSAGPRGKMSLMQDFAVANNSFVSWGFTGTVVGAYATKSALFTGNEGEGRGMEKASVSNWRYEGWGQVVD